MGSGDVCGSSGKTYKMKPYSEFELETKEPRIEELKTESR